MAEQFIYLGSTKIQEGSGSPETSVTSQKGSLFLRNDGGVGTTLYIKETGTGNTGWSALGASSFDPAAATEIVFTTGLTTSILGPTDTSLVIQSSANGSGIARSIDILSANGGAGTSVYFKESGAGNTGWVGK